MIYLVHRPISGDIVGMTASELTEHFESDAMADDAGLAFKIEMAFELETHVCGQDSQEFVPPDTWERFDPR